MRPSDIDRIESELQISLNGEYRGFLLAHSDELPSLYKSLGWNSGDLWSSADEIIAENKDAKPLYDFFRIRPDDQPWPANYLFVGTNLGGDYWFVDLSGERAGLWFYSHETQEIEQVNPSLDAYIAELRTEIEEQPKRERAAREKAEREYSQLTFDRIGLSSLFHAARDKRSTDRLAALLAAGHDVNTRNLESGETPLWGAVLVENWPAIELLLKAGADVTIPDNDGRTPLHYCDDKRLAESFLARGANPNAADKYGRTPLHSAAINGSEEVMGVLLHNGADKSIRDLEGKSPLDWAIEEKEDNVIDLLR